MQRSLCGASGLGLEKVFYLRSFAYLWCYSTYGKPTETLRSVPVIRIMPLIKALLVEILLYFCFITSSDNLRVRGIACARFKSLLKDELSAQPHTNYPNEKVFGTCQKKRMVHIAGTSGSWFQRMGCKGELNCSPV